MVIVSDIPRHRAQMGTQFALNPKQLEPDPRIRKLNMIRFKSYTHRVRLTKAYILNLL